MKKPAIFGKYLLLERINVGGMAEVFIAKAFGVEGFERILAIKKILPTMAEDREFITMFIDEARISVQLSHANVVQIHELGRYNDAFFIAMEYVAGRDLRTLIEHFRRTKQKMEPAMAAFIASKICDGLDYAHRKKDARGEDLNIIHRDVSPQNVLVSFEGEVKLIDFGIAKAANRNQKTQAGILKGKFGYMSPEQVRGLPIDRRSDVFAVGVLLYELLTGEKLFVGESDFSTLEKVRNAEIPSLRKFNPSVSPALEKVIRKALAREQEDRYQWASDLQEDLLRFVVEEQSIYSAKQLARFMREAFAGEMARDADRMERYAAIPRPTEMDVSSVGPAPTAPASAPTPNEVASPAGPPPPPPAAFQEAFDDEDDGATEMVSPELVSSAMAWSAPGSPPSPERDALDLTDPGIVGGPADVAGEATQAKAPIQRQQVVIGDPSLAGGATVVGPAPSRPEGLVLASEGGLEVADDGDVVDDEFLDEDPDSEDAVGLESTAPRTARPPRLSQNPRPTTRGRKRIRRMLPVAIGVACALLLLVLAGLLLKPASPEPVESRRGADDARVEASGLGSGAIPSSNPAEGRRGMDGEVASASGGLDDAEPEQAEAPGPPAAKTFTAIFSSELQGIEIEVEGRTIGRTPEVRLDDLEVGRDYTFTAKRAGYRTHSSSFRSEGDLELPVRISLQKIPPAPPKKAVLKRAPPERKTVRPARTTRTVTNRKPAAKGKLACSTNPAGATIYVNGESTGRSTPVPLGNPLELPVGNHRIVFKIGSRESVPLTVKIEEDELITLRNVQVR